MTSPAANEGHREEISGCQVVLEFHATVSKLSPPHSICYVLWRHILVVRITLNPIIAFSNKQHAAEVANLRKSL